MNHDITHCTGVDCANRNDCLRYQAHLEVKSGAYESTRIPYFINPRSQKCFKEENA